MLEIEGNVSDLTDILDFKVGNKKIEISTVEILGVGILGNILISFVVE